VDLLPKTRPASRELKRRWSHFIRKVYETYPILLTISTVIFSFVPALPVQSGHQLVANDPPVDQLAYKFSIF